MTMGAIFELNGLKRSDFSDEKDMETTLKDLIADSENEFQYTSEIKDHTNPHLKKYLYMHNQGLLHTEGSKHAGTLESSADLDKKALHDLVPSGSSGPDIVIKAESPELQALKDNLKELKVSKKRLEQLLSDALDMVASLNSQKPGSADEFQRLTVAASEFLSEYRNFVGVADRSSVSVAAAPSLVERSKHMKGLMDAHKDGLQHNLKKYRPFLN